MRGIAENGAESHTDGHDEENQIPPVWGFAVLGHESHVDVRFLVSRCAESIPDLFAVEQGGVDDACHESCKRQSVIEDKGGREEEWRVAFVFCFVECEARSHDLGDVIGTLCIIECGRCVDGKVIGVQSATKADTDGRDDDEDDESHESVEMRKGRRQKRVAEIARHVGPVKGERYQGETCEAAKELIESGIIRSNPRHEGED